MHSKSVAEFVGADVVHLAGLGIDKPWQSSFFGTPRYDLPASMSIYAEYESLAVTHNWTVAADKSLQQSQCIGVDGQYPLAMVCLLLDLSCIDLGPAFGAKGVASAESLATPGAG